MQPGPLRTTFRIPRMDCPSEERLIRMALDGVPGVHGLCFDLAGRTLQATHDGPATELLSRLQPLGLGAEMAGSVAAGEADAVPAAPDDASEARLLWTVLAINAGMFVLELGVGLLAQSAGLIADALDMFADAAVYGLALYAVGRSAAMKARAAHAAGWLQLALALGALSEVLRRWLFGSEPESTLMMGMGLLALVANVACLLLLARQRHGGTHLRASFIFSTNDVIANAGVILAGAMVAWTGSRYPDLVIGAVVGAVVLQGAVRILRLR